MRRTADVAWRDFCDRVEALGGRVVETQWLGRNKRHQVVCKAGHETTTTPGNVALGRGICRVCAGKDPQAAWAAFRTRVAELGGQVLEDEWLGCQTPHRALCAKGHDCTPRPNDVQQGRGLCRTCAGNDTLAAERAFRLRIAELGGRIVEPEWLGAAKPHRVICLQGHECCPRPHDALSGHGICLTCAGKDPAVTERAFRDSLTAVEARMTEPSWLGARRFHRIICREGHETTAHPAVVARGGAACRICAGRTPERLFDAFRSRVEALGGQVVEAGWLGSTVGHRCICREGHECVPWPAAVGQGQGLCRICAGNDSENAWLKFREAVVDLGGKMLEPEWLGTSSRHRIVCREGHKTSVLPWSVRGGQGLCRFCAGKTWDAFYVVTNDQQARVKFGITSGNPRHRLATHRRGGYETVVRTITAFAEAPQLESSVLATLRLAEVKPVHGREYYDISALGLILDIVDHWPLVAQRP